MTEKSLLDALNWRYATNKFDIDKKLDETTLSTILEAANLSATSFGLQAYKIVVLEASAWKDKLEDVTFGQENVQTCSHLIVLCARTDMDEDYIRSYVHYMEKVRELKSGTMDRFAEVCIDFIHKMEKDDLTQWLRRQLYIVLGNMLTTCAILGVDACPMEGFIPNKLDKVLSLQNHKLRSVLLFPVGYRAADDKYAHFKKVRKPLNEMVVRM